MTKLSLGSKSQKKDFMKERLNELQDEIWRLEWFVFVAWIVIILLAFGLIHVIL
jgi:hypothetical protein